MNKTLLFIYILIVLSLNFFLPPFLISASYNQNSSLTSYTEFVKKSVNYDNTTQVTYFSTPPGTMCTADVRQNYHGLPLPSIGSFGGGCVDNLYIQPIYTVINLVFWLLPLLIIHFIRKKQPANPSIYKS